MRIDIITCLPSLLQSPLNHSIVKRARDKGVVEIEIHDLREITPLKHRQVDDYLFGGGAGMALMPEPLSLAIRQLQAKRTYDAVIYFTPDGDLLNQKAVNKFSLFENMMMICGHYKGIDQRIRDLFVTHEVSIGDYVVSGGELAAAVLTDAIVRVIPGAIGDETSALTDSFQDDLLAPPIYTRPADFEGHKVPDILLSGHEAKIEEWRHQKSLEITKLRRPELYKKWLDANNQ